MATQADGVHWQDPTERLYNQPWCGIGHGGPCATNIEAVTCPVCKAQTRRAPVGSCAPRGDDEGAGVGNDAGPVVPEAQGDE